MVNEIFETFAVEGLAGIGIAENKLAIIIRLL
jgi:hypothetical protein